MSAAPSHSDPTIDTQAEEVRRCAEEMAARTGRPIEHTLHAWRAFTRYWDEPLTSSNWDVFRPAMSTSPRRVGSPSEWFLLFQDRWVPPGLAVTVATHGITAGEASSVHAEVMATPGFARAHRDLLTGNNPSTAVRRLVTSWRWHIARAAQGLTGADRLNLQVTDNNWMTNLSGPSSEWTPGQPVADEVRDAWATLAALKRTV
jgi:hypothetical protein